MNMRAKLWLGFTAALTIGMMLSGMPLAPAFLLSLAISPVLTLIATATSHIHAGRPIFGVHVTRPWGGFSSWSLFRPRPHVVHTHSHVPSHHRQAAPHVHTTSTKVGSTYVPKPQASSRSFFGSMFQSTPSKSSGMHAGPTCRTSVPSASSTHVGRTFRAR